jgi:hypothetical protein
MMGREQARACARGGKREKEEERMSNNKEKKLRILCLHGFYQNAAVFRMKTGSFRYPLSLLFYSLFLVLLELIPFSFYIMPPTVCMYIRHLSTPFHSLL